MATEEAWPVAAQEQIPLGKAPELKAAETSSLERETKRVEVALKNRDLSSLENIVADYEAGASLGASSRIDLMLHLGRGLVSIDMGSSAEKDRLYQKIATTVFAEFATMTLNQKMSMLSFLSGYEIIGLLSRDDAKITAIGVLAQTEQTIKQQKLELDRITVPAEIDLTKYNWSNQIIFIGMSPLAINKPELQRAYQSALDREEIIRQQAVSKRDLSRWERLFSVLSSSFIERIKNVTDEDLKKIDKLVTEAGMGESAVLAKMKDKLKSGKK